MIRITYEELRKEFVRILKGLHFTEKKASICADIFAQNTLDGINSHGINRFPVFVRDAGMSRIDIMAEPECVSKEGGLEIWDGHEGVGVYNASLAIERAIKLARNNGIGSVFMKNTNHWMRGGTYGWRAAEAGCIGICFTNAIAGMPAWGGSKPRLGNNPIVMAVPRPEGHIILDTALSQFSYGKLQEYQMENKELPFPGGYDDQGLLTKDPKIIRENKRALPIGFWKGSGLALLLDVILTAVTGGNSTRIMTERGVESGVCQGFICIFREELHPALIEEILQYTKSENEHQKDGAISFPGERTLLRRQQNRKEGIPVDKETWEKILAM